MSQWLGPPQKRIPIFCIFGLRGDFEMYNEPLITLEQRYKGKDIEKWQFYLPNQSDLKEIFEIYAQIVYEYFKLRADNVHISCYKFAEFGKYNSGK